MTQLPALGRGTIVAPFVFDGLQAKLAEQVGFEAVYMTGFGTAASHGLPDLGLLTMSEMVDRARLLAAAVAVPVICDADTGYGNPLNVARTVRAFEAAGAAAIHLEDQVFPKRCGFLGDKQVVEADVMVAKLRAALDQRDDPGFRIIARTDALQPNGWDDVCRRAERYMEAGADMIFVDGIATPADLDRYSERLAGRWPCLYNGMLESTDALCARGFAVVIHPGTMLKLFADLRATLVALKQSGCVELEAIGAFGDILQALGVPDALALAKRYGG